MIFASIRIILALIVGKNLELHQMHMKIAFLNGDFEKEIYMAQPKGFGVLGCKHKLCKLKKLIYDLK